MKINVFVFVLCALISATNLFSQNIQNNPNSNHGSKFEQLGTILPTPNSYRTASGSTGSDYWQQKADYDIACQLDEANQILNGTETITYTNNSPDVLTYLWLQLDENEHHVASDNNSFDQSKLSPVMSDVRLNGLIDKKKNLEGLGVVILEVKDVLGKSLNYVVNQTMMRVDLPAPLKSKSAFIFKVKWKYKIPNRVVLNSSRGGYEYFEKDKNYLFTISQWYPRMCVYSDFQGWQNKQFTGRGEFAVNFGDFKVSITVPSDHVVAATGECQNYASVLTATQMSRWQKAQTAKEPVEIVSLPEAIEASKRSSSTQTKTWVYVAKNVRDFAWTSSRRFVWDAMKVKVNNNATMCMSLYCKEAYPLYSKYSTKTIAHTIKTYSKHTIDYPYPTAISVEAANGMEYPMICFNYGRANEDGTYTESVKYGMLSVIIHEVGHNFFPMIINSDERQWSWMDEGLNTFTQYLTEQEFSNNYPSRRGPAYTIVDYMKMPASQLEPIMTNSDNIIRFGDNAYGKPAAALNILRETIMGRELFDYAFKEYARRWAFKHPTPADFFRTMEDASAVDLDWFWRAWFFDITPVDIALDSVKIYQEDLSHPVAMQEKVTPKKELKEFRDVTKLRNRADKKIKFLVEEDTSLIDFYDSYVPEKDTTTITTKNFDTLNEETKTQIVKNKFFYELYFTNQGGTVMPLIIEWNFTDGSKEVERIPAEVWRHNEKNITKVFIKNKEVKSLQLDPYKETADIDESNNAWPQKIIPSKFQLFKGKQVSRNFNDDIGLNPMQKARQATNKNEQKN